MDFLESYMNITLLSVSALKLAHSHLQTLLSPADRLEFVLIGDDDTYINLPGMRRGLFQQTCFLGVTYSHILSCHSYLCLCILRTYKSSHFPLGILYRIMAASLWKEEEHHQSNTQKTSLKLLYQSLASKNKKVQKSDPSSLQTQNDNFLMGYLLRKTMPLNWSPNDVRTRGRYISLKVV